MRLSLIFSKTVALAAPTFALVVATGCATTTAETDEATASEAITSTQCADRIKQRALDRALELSDTASVVSTHTLYGDERGYADAVLVRISDEVEPTDYLVVRSRLRNGVVSPATCSIKKTLAVAEGVLPDDSLVRGAIGAGCDASIRAAVLKKALKLSDTATVTGVKLVYGGDRTFGGVAIVRVSDETEPTDYVAAFSLTGSEQARAGTCKVRTTELLNEGVLPAIDGL